MQFKYFKTNGLTTNLTIEEAKRQYRKLALKYHPDMGGSLEAMKAVNAEWDYLKTHNYNIHETKDGGVYTDWNQDAADDITARYAEIIEQLIKMEGVTIEVCGSFLWLSGNTRAHKEEIKGLGFRWASKKKRWFLAPQGWRKKGRRELTMGEIRGTYGSRMVAANGFRNALTA